VILTLTSTLPGNGTITSTTSGIALKEILMGAAIVGAVLLASLVVTELLSSRQVWNTTAAVTARVITVTLLLTFCVFVVFKAVQLVKAKRGAHRTEARCSPRAS